MFAVTIINKQLIHAVCRCLLHLLQLPCQSCRMLSLCSLACRKRRLTESSRRFSAGAIPSVMEVLNTQQPFDSHGGSPGPAGILQFQHQHHHHHHHHHHHRLQYSILTTQKTSSVISAISDTTYSMVLMYP